MIQRIGFGIANFPRPANEPWHASSLTLSTQATFDSEYLQALAFYYDRADGWIETQKVIRLSSADPKSCKPAPFLEDPPRRKRVTYSASGTLIPVEEEIDSRIPRPELPPYEEPSQGPGFRKDTPPNVEIMNALGAIWQKLDAIEAAVKAK